MRLQPGALSLARQGQAGKVCKEQDADFQLVASKFQ